MADRRNPDNAPAEARYRPMMSAELAERVRAWHERAYAAMLERETLETSYLGRRLTIPPQVFPVTPMSDLLGRAVLEDVQKPDRVLDMGTGCGVNAILAASRSTEIVAVDINPDAIECARKNAAANGVESHIEFLESDVFDRVEGKFDLMVFDPPFRWFAPRDSVEVAIADENYGALTRFMQQAQDRLNPGGRILLFFGTSGDLAYVQKLIDDAGFAREIVGHRSLTQDDWTVDYYAFRLTVAPP